MADLAYMRNRPTTLQDLLNQANLQPDAPVETPAPPQPSQVATDGTMTPQDRQRLLDVLFAPEDPGPAPQVDKPSALAMLFSGLGDAVTGFVAGKSGNPGYQSNFFDQYQNKMNQQKADLQRYQEKTAQGRNRSKQRTAEYLLGQDDAALGRIGAERQKLADKQEAALLRAKERQEKVNDVVEAARIAQDRLQYEQTQINERNRLDNLARTQEARIRASADATNEGNKGKQKIHDQQVETLTEAKQAINAKKAEWKQRLEAGEDPAVIREEWVDARDASSFLPEFGAEADAYYEAKIGPFLEAADRHKFAQGYEGQGPSQGATPEQTAAAQAAARRGQRY